MSIYDLAVLLDKFKLSRKNESSVQILNNKEIIIDCCKEVLVYDDNFIKLKLAANTIQIIGFELKLSNFSIDGIVVKGLINSITFEENCK